ncbi:PAS-domain containing protein [Rhodopila sp.]|uniref:PAS-domain containing protein n=1 Tax=Rhodopila sp. TaxID=2480087 RepID=UPI003D0A116E
MTGVDTLAPKVAFATVFEAIPVGLAVVDAKRRIVLMNAAFHTLLGLNPERFPFGSKIEDLVRAAALPGIAGSGDPEAQVMAVMTADHGKPGRLCRGTFAGRDFDLYNTPLADGGYIVSAMEITGRMVAPAEAEGALAQTATALAALRLGLAIFNPQGALLLSNPRFAELMDLPAERVTAGFLLRHMLDLMETREAFSGQDGAAFVASLRETGRSRRGTAWRRRGGGRLVDVMCDPLAGGGWAITVNDVTALATAEDEARRRARLLDSILLAVPHGICVYGPDRRVSMFNQTYQDVMAGAPLRIGDHLTTVIRRRAEAGEYGAGAPNEIFEQQMGFDISRTQSRRRVRPNGSAIDVRTVPLPDGGHISVVTDISALVQAEAEARRRVEEMAVMLDSLHHGILLWDADRRLIASNRMASHLYDLPPDLLIAGRREAEVVDVLLREGHLGTEEAASASIEALLMRDRSMSHEQEIRTASGRVLAIRSNPAPAGGWVSTIVDTTKAQAAEAELRQAKLVAEAANAAKSRFLATMSHELRTPLNVIIGFSEALLRHVGQSSATPASVADLADFGSQINAAGKQLLALINTILDVARIETGRFEPGDEVVDVAQVVRRAVRQTESAALAAEIALDCRLPDDLPWVRADERRLLQVLSQLLSNAVKFTEAGGSVTVEVALAADGDLRLRVADTGIGIPEAELERVFEPFIQLDNTLSRRYGGTGLGLYTARAIVAAQGGEITLASQLGTGTIVEISIPARRVVQ